MLFVGNWDHFSVPGGFMGIYIRENRGKLYLDIYWNGIRRWEKTGLTIPKDPATKKEVMKLAEKIRAKREMQLVSGEFAIQDLTAAKQALVTYAEKVAEGQPAKNPLPKSIKYLRLYAGNIGISAVNEQWIAGYRDYLIKQPTLGPNSQARYLSSLRRVLNQAVRDHIIVRNPALNVKGIKEEEPDTVFLTVTELTTLAQAPLPAFLEPDIRRAFLFSCYVGLRISDLQTLEWRMIERETRTIRKIQYKTKQAVTIPIADDAWKLIDDGRIHDGAERVFPKLKDTSGDTDRLLRKWAKGAGIDKWIAWHAARRTFGTMALRSGADLATVSKLLGHTSIAYTQRYLRVDSESVRSAIANMPSIDLTARQSKIIPMRKVEGGKA